MSTEFTKVEQVAIAIQNEAKMLAASMSDGASMRLARVAIEAMREPTADMFDRGIEAMQDMDGESKQANLKHLWPAMIDEALK